MHPHNKHHKARWLAPRPRGSAPITVRPTGAHVRTAGQPLPPLEPGRAGSPAALSPARPSPPRLRNARPSGSCDTRAPLPGEPSAQTEAGLSKDGSSATEQQPWSSGLQMHAGGLTWPSSPAGTAAPSLSPPVCPPGWDPALTRLSLSSPQPHVCSEQHAAACRTPAAAVHVPEARAPSRSPAVCLPTR